ncbi:ribbon-helix-helix protein, CopG family (plasmid) [Agrobacterium rosae]|uniref:Ribbon-helix-helix protein, CopG family n=1 Tax=Agrobacterium rosae TaxID=1972867 RepID=A0ABU4W510_9HYPH|nr:ribbon-helix-helix protein, CopG family [Agrobacterium rosae]MDX8332870.1 ribbon-helix-helix protein, CopG family [Agrobacterium rosae]
MPGDIVAEIDRLKQERGASSRAPILEEAVRFYLEQTRA